MFERIRNFVASSRCKIFVTVSCSRRRKQNTLELVNNDSLTTTMRNTRPPAQRRCRPVAAHDSPVTEALSGNEALGIWKRDGERKENRAADWGVEDEVGGLSSTQPVGDRWRARGEPGSLLYIRFCAALAQLAPHKRHIRARRSFSREFCPFAMYPEISNLIPSLVRFCA